jgi:hypothetical protein
MFFNKKLVCLRKSMESTFPLALILFDQDVSASFHNNKQPSAAAQWLWAAGSGYRQV